MFNGGVETARGIVINCVGAIFRGSAATQAGGREAVKHIPPSGFRHEYTGSPSRPEFGRSMCPANRSPAAPCSDRGRMRWFGAAMRTLRS
jgi:hypothetical protein